jgi:hypothetical protein
MRELILNEIMAMVIDMSELDHHDWVMMLDFDLGIINADEEEIDLEDHERRGGQMRHWLSDCDDDTVLEVYNYLRDEFMPVALVA